MFERILFLLMIFSNDATADNCQKWFEKSKVQLGKGCILDCVSSPVDMISFQCHDQCNQLCKSSGAEDWIFQLSDLYPGLTGEERALAAKEPIKMLSAYKLTWAAEKMCLKIYSKSRTNDESDACRHFIWAAYLYKEFGNEFGTQVLNAHEQDPDEPANERAMDLANNRLGMLTGEQLVKNNKFNEESVLNSFKDNLKKGNLIVIKSPQGIK